MNGDVHRITLWHAQIVLILGWLSFLLSTIFNIIYYTVHPMAPQVSIRGKLVTHVFGCLWNMTACTCNSVEDSLEEDGEEESEAEQNMLMLKEFEKE